jgi:hypothetical protein
VRFYRPTGPTATPTPASFAFALASNGLSDLAIPLDVSGSGITNAESLATYIETQGGAPAGSIVQLMKWNPGLQTLLAWSHQFGFGDNFAVGLGDYIFLTASGGPTSVTLYGRRPAPGELQFALTPGQPSPDCVINTISLPLDQGQITNADDLSDDIGGVVQALDWDAPLQNFLAWSNENGFGDNFPTTMGYPYIVCLDNNAPTQWP